MSARYSHHDRSSDDYRREYKEFCQALYRSGIEQGLWTQEQIRQFQSSPPTADTAHNLEVMELHMLKNFDVVRAKRDGLLDEDTMRSILQKNQRKIGTCAQCDRCGNLRCGKCKQVHYCSKECQKAHWATHKQECKSFCQANGG